MPRDPDFTLGIEEEYLLVDPATGGLAPAPDALMADCARRLGDAFSPEFLRCQIEVGTPVSTGVAQARDHLAGMRRTVAEVAQNYGLAPVSVSCHPFEDWRDQHHTDKSRYRQLSRDLGAVSRRMLICGMHVHVGLGDRDLRIDLMNRLVPFLPRLLALSASSPFWLGEDTGLASYRTIVFGGMPRTGLPPHFGTWADYDRSVRALTDAGVIQDASRIWWDLRPSSRFPTLETRICDASPRLDDTITLAALIQATLRMLWSPSERPPSGQPRDSLLVAENRWRATRHGMAEGLIDTDAGRVLPFAELAEQWLAGIAPHADALGSGPQVARARGMLVEGGAAARQRAVLSRALTAGATRDEALREVVRHLVQEFLAGL